MPTFSSPAKGWNFIDSTYTRSDTPGVQVLQRSAGLISFGTNERVTTSDPNWRVKLAKRLEATNPYSFKEWVSVVSYLSHCTTLRRDPGLEIHGECLQSYFGGGYGLVSDSDDTALRDLALARVKNRLQSHYGNVNAVVPVVELRDLRHTITGTAKLATDLLHTLTAIRKTKGASARKYAADAWLNFSFGVNPLISDTAKIASSIQDYLDRKDHSTRITGVASKNWFSSLKETGQTSAFGAGLSTHSVGYHTLSYKYIAGFDILVEAANNYSIVDHLGLRPEQLLSVAWELTPYSWVVDYFATVGPFLDDTFVVPPGSTKFVLLDRLYTLDVDIRTSIVPSSGTIVTSQSKKPGYLKYVHFDRSRLTSLPRIGLHFRSFDSVGSYAVNKLLNLASVFYNGRKR